MIDVEDAAVTNLLRELVRQATVSVQGHPSGAIHREPDFSGSSVGLCSPTSVARFADQSCPLVSVRFYCCPGSLLVQIALDLPFVLTFLFRRRRQVVNSVWRDSRQPHGSHERNRRPTRIQDIAIGDGLKRWCGDCRRSRCNWSSRWLQQYNVGSNPTARDECSESQEIVHSPAYK